MLLVASREIQTNISQGIYEARYDRKIARMVAQSILVGSGEAGVTQESWGDEVCVYQIVMGAIKDAVSY
ncbi:unnamed protein product [Leptidea sinapis]|uniref:Uncharacterized protein n=1 Tax=Leptidea sinapis TaxID=189913 RepID=A0A5E4PQT6_9NEOP|nr:unnamed protein product [Leptidea sinapis]